MKRSAGSWSVGKSNTRGQAVPPNRGAPQAWPASVYLTLGQPFGQHTPVGRVKLGSQLVSLLLAGFRTPRLAFGWCETNSETNWVRTHAAASEQAFAI